MAELAGRGWLQERIYEKVLQEELFQDRVTRSHSSLLLGVPPAPCPPLTGYLRVPITKHVDRRGATAVELTAKVSDDEDITMERKLRPGTF